MQELIRQYEETLPLYKCEIEGKMSEEDWLEYNEILFSAHSCAIEGNSFSVDDTRELKEFGVKAKLQNKTLLEAYEILDHFRAYEYMLSKIGSPLTEELLRELHRLVTQHTLPYRAKDAVPGEYTTVDMAAGSTVFGDHEELIAQVPKLLSATQRQMNQSEVHPVRLAAMFHCFFEYLHPFRDGNGRVGRLMANFILLSLKQPLVIIRQEQKQQYIAALRFYKQERSTEMIERFFLETAISRMKQELQEKTDNTKNIYDEKILS